MGVIGLVEAQSVELRHIVVTIVMMSNMTVLLPTVKVRTGFHVEVLIESEAGMPVVWSHGD